MCVGLPLTRAGCRHGVTPEALVAAVCKTGLAYGTVLRAMARKDDHAAPTPKDSPDACPRPLPGGVPAPATLFWVAKRGLPLRPVLERMGWVPCAVLHSCFTCFSCSVDGAGWVMVQARSECR